MRIDSIEVEDTYAEAFDGLFCRLIVTAGNQKLLKKAVISVTSLPSTVFGESEGGVETWLKGNETPDGRDGAVIQLWVNYSKDGRTVLERELGKRIRQGVLVVPSTRVFNALDSEEKIDAMEKIGHCGDGFESIENRFGREMINIPIMMGEFLIERSLGFSKGVMGGNLWIYCASEKAALISGEMAVEAVSRIPFAITPFDICSAGSKVETKFQGIGPTTNHPYCPTLRNKIKDSRVPPGVKSIPEIIINGKTLQTVKEAMEEAIYEIKGQKGVIKISAGNFNGKLGKYKIFLKDLLEGGKKSNLKQ
jgi:formylmethanofuran--tetrahydromethanopterin N-formyltransferase